MKLAHFTIFYMAEFRPRGSDKGQGCVVFLWFNYISEMCNMFNLDVNILIIKLKKTLKVFDKQNTVYRKN